MNQRCSRCVRRFYGLQAAATTIERDTEARHGVAQRRESLAERDPQAKLLGDSGFLGGDVVGVGELEAGKIP